MVDAGDQPQDVTVVPGDMDGAASIDEADRAECPSRQASVRIGRADQPQTIAGPRLRSHSFPFLDGPLARPEVLRAAACRTRATGSAGCRSSTSITRPISGSSRSRGSIAMVPDDLIARLPHQPRRCVNAR
jgi:hypothetical protein